MDASRRFRCKQGIGQVTKRRFQRDAALFNFCLKEFFVSILEGPKDRIDSRIDLRSTRSGNAQTILDAQALTCRRQGDQKRNFKSRKLKLIIEFDSVPARKHFERAAI